MIYIDDHIWDFDLLEALDAVSPQRREYALRFKHERDRRLCVAVYRLLQQALRQEYGMDEVPPFSFGNGGKPSLQGFPDIFFSLSHCDEAVACAVDVQPVGIDVECIGRYDEEIAHHVMSQDEYAAVLASAQPAVAFTRLWTMKESLFKAVGDAALLPGGGDPKRMLDAGGVSQAYRFHTVVTQQWVLTCCNVR